ncbi:MAG TPA: ABC transporter substrate-binding protein [Stellaceae bacterium]|nr:ABC transporter substrate-binding protein [Stellaceae bacterium]
MRIRSFLLVAGVAGLLLQAAPVLAAESAADFIAQAGNSVLTLARDRSLSEAELKQRLGAIAEKDFDAPRIAKFVLGRYWRTASEAERQQFIQAFENYMVQVYASRFRQYGGAQFKVTGERQDGQTSMVTTDIAQPNGQPAHVIWQVVQTPSGYKIIDVSIEGISQAVTYRQEFSSVIEQNGGRIAALTQQLRQKANS